MKKYVNSRSSRAPGQWSSKELIPHRPGKEKGIAGCVDPRQACTACLVPTSPDGGRGERCHHHHQTCRGASEGMSCKEGVAFRQTCTPPKGVLCQTASPEACRPHLMQEVLLGSQFLSHRALRDLHPTQESKS